MAEEEGGGGAGGESADSETKVQRDGDGVESGDESPTSRIRVCMCACVHVCMCVCVHVCMYT